MKSLGKLLVEPTEDILKSFLPVEGQVAFYYGRIRNGKTYAATADILDLLRSGEVVYANWQVDFSGFDERDSFKVALVRLFFGKRYFYRYLGDNFHYFDPDNVPLETLSRLVNAHIFVDEGQWLFNSHASARSNDPEQLLKRRMILHNGHYCRSLNFISQRPMNVFKDMRSQINVWYKCEKVLSYPWLVFRRTTYEDMKDDMPDEGQEKAPVKLYFARKSILQSYSTHAMRGADAIDSKVVYEVYEATFWERLLLVLRGLPLVGRLLRPTKKADHKT